MNTVIQPLAVVAAAGAADPADVVAAVQCLMQDAPCMLAVVEQLLAEETAETVQIGTAAVGLDMT